MKKHPLQQSPNAHFWRLVTVVIYSALFYANEGHAAWFNKSEDSNVHNSPLKLPLVGVQRTLDKPPASGLGAGIAYNPWRDEFVISTDQPHRLFSGGKASVWFLNESMQPLTEPLIFKTDGDLEGITVLDENHVATISETGSLYIIRQVDDKASIVSALPALKGHVNALSSLAYDPDNEHLFSAEKVGPKVIYTFDRTGKLLKHFELTFSNSAMENGKASLADDFSIAGLQFHRGYL